MNALNLNFLKEKPSENWFDYFVAPQSFQELLQNEKFDHVLVGQLFDQFVENALAEGTESKNQNREDAVNGDDNAFTEKKIDRLWVSAWACAARLGWNLDELLRNSNVIRVYSAISRLFEKTFQVNGESDIFACFARLDDAVFTSKNVFVAWLYTKLVLMIDMQARVPPPTQKPTVSNPNFQVDPALVEAEKTNIFVSTVRKHVRNAVTFMERLILMVQRKSSPLKKIDFPTLWNYEHYWTGPRTNDEKINVNTSPRYVNVGVTSFITRCRCDLLLAHFAATHVRSATRLLHEIIPTFSTLSQVHPSLKELFYFGAEKFEGFKAALPEENSTAKRPRIDCNPYEFFTLPSTSTAAKRVSNFCVNQDLIDAQQMYTRVNTQKPVVNVWRAPTEAETSTFSNCGPHLWNMIHCYDYPRLLEFEVAFRESRISDDGVFRTPNPTASVSPVFAGLLQEAPINNEPVLYYLIQLEKLVENNDLNTWTSMIETFVRRFMQPNSPWRESVYLLGYEVLRVRMKLWNNMAGKQLNNQAFNRLTKETLKMLCDSLNSTVPRMEWSLRHIAVWYFMFLLNTEAYETVLRFRTSVPDFQSPYFDFARLVTTAINCEQQALPLLWQYFGRLLDKTQRSYMTDENFLDVVSMAKNVNITEYYLSFFIPFYNRLLLLQERKRLPYTEETVTVVEANCINLDVFDATERPIPEDRVGSPENMDLKYLCMLNEILLRNLYRMCPNKPTVLRQLADLEYSKQNFSTAARLYTTALRICECKLAISKDFEKVFDDKMLSKLIHCLYELQLYTLSAICGQLLDNISPHLEHMPLILKQTINTRDAGKAYFPYIYSIPLFESMTEAYNRHELYVYYINLLKLCPSKALVQANSNEVVQEETRRRRLRFVNILCDSTPSEKPS